MILSILISSLECRGGFLRTLLGVLSPQLTPEVEVIVDTDNGERSIGRKRNDLLYRAKGKYVAFLDDDDDIDGDYVASILDAARHDRDVITFNMDRVVDGRPVGYEIMSLDHTEYKIDRTNQARLVWLYPPTHVCPVKRELARQVEFKDTNQGEDTDWSDRLRPLLKSEHHVDAVLYTYYFRNDRRGEMTNQRKRDQETELGRQLDTLESCLMAIQYGD